MGKHDKHESCREKKHCHKQDHHSTECEDSKDSEECKKTIGLIGVGCAGGYLLNQLSTKYKVNAYEAGWDRRNDGFTYNLGLPAPTVHSQYDKVGPNNPGYPAGNTQWNGITFQQPYTLATVTATGPVITSPQSWNQGIMLGGSNEHIQGVYVNPSKSRCEWWSEILDDRYSFENLFPLLQKMEHFRDNTDFTTQTFDSTTYGPYDGPSINGSDPINRGYDGVLQVVQASPSSYSLSLSKAIYNQFHDTLDYENFKLEPIVNQENSETFNSGANLCVTQSVETFLDKHRVRSSVARAYLNPSVMQSVTPNINSLYIGSYPGAGVDQFYLNKGIQKGINGHDFTLTQNALVMRIVFETKSNYPDAPYYWINTSMNLNADQVKRKAFKKPLHAIGFEYADQTDLNTRIFVPCDDVICCLGTLATPALLMQSGIGPEDALKSIGVPVLYKQKNMGKHISNHAGTILRWQGNATFWGNTATGTDNSNGYLPGPEHHERRKFQYYSGYTPVTTVATGGTGSTGPSWTMNLYDLNPKSTGFLTATSSSGVTGPTGYAGGVTPGTAGGTLLNVAISPNYYTNNEDIDNLCWIVRNVAAAIVAADSSATFLAPNLPYPFPVSNQVLFAALVPGFTAQAHYVGSCGMGGNKKVHCVDKEFLLRGTDNVHVCDASSTPLDVDCKGVVYPVQNDGNTSRGVNALTAVFAEQLLK